MQAAVRIQEKAWARSKVSAFVDTSKQCRVVSERDKNTAQAFRSPIVRVWGSTFLSEDVQHGRGSLSDKYDPVLGFGQVRVHAVFRFESGLAWQGQDFRGVCGRRLGLEHVG